MARTRGTIRRLAVILAFAAVPLSSASAQAACSKTWGSTSGSWTTAANWSPVGVPGPADDVCLTGTQNYTVTVPAVAGGIHVRTITVGGEVGSVQTLEIDGQSVAANPATQQDTPLDAALGGSIASTGRIVLNATDDGTTRTPGETPGGSAILSGGPFTNAGTILAQSSSPRLQKDYLRAPITNVAGGVLRVTNGLLWYDAGTTFLNNGTITMDGPGNLVFTTDAALSPTPTHLINSGVVVTNGGVQMELASWTQAGGTVTGDSVQISNGSLDFQSGMGAFTLSEQLGGAATSTLSGTIPNGSQVLLRGGTYGTTPIRPWTVQVTGAELVNRGTLYLDAIADTPSSQGGPVILQGAPIRNFGIVQATTEGAAGYADSLRTDITNEPGGVLDIDSNVIQEGGSAVVNHGDFNLYAGHYAVTAGLTGSAISTFTNAPDGTMEFGLLLLAVPTFQIDLGGSFFAGGDLRPDPQGTFKVPQGGLVKLFPVTGGTVTGRFASVQFGYRADYSHPDYIGVIYGARLEKISTGRGALSVALSCPASKPCPRATVRATAKQRVHGRLRTVPVGTVSGAVTAGHTRTLTLTLNRVGRRLLARSPGRLAVRVVVQVGGTTLATRGVRIQRL